MEDPEFPGEDEFLYFVFIEFNIEDIKEYKRITALEMTGTLDPDGVKAFVDVTQLNWDSILHHSTYYPQFNWLFVQIGRPPRVTKSVTSNQYHPTIPHAGPIFPDHSPSTQYHPTIPHAGLIFPDHSPSTQAGGCLDGKQHLALGDKLGAEGVAKMLGSVGLKGDASATKTKKGKGQRKPKASAKQEAKEAHTQSIHGFRFHESRFRMFHYTQSTHESTPCHGTGYAGDSFGKGGEAAGKGPEGCEQLPDTRLHYSIVKWLDMDCRLCFWMNPLRQIIISQQPI